MVGKWKAAGVSNLSQAFPLKSDLIDMLQASAKLYIILPQGQSSFDSLIADLLALEINDIELRKFLGRS